MNMMTHILSTLPLALLIAAPSAAKENDKTPVADPKLRIAVFDIEVQNRIDVTPAAITDRINAILSDLDFVTTVNRDELQKSADEQKLALSGLVDPDDAVALGRFVSAQYIAVGRLSRVDQTLHLIVRFIDVETTVQKIVSIDAPAEGGVPAIVAQLENAIKDAATHLQESRHTATEVDDGRMLEIAKPLAGSSVLIDISEQHIARPLSDPAAATTAFNALRRLGLLVVLPNDPPDGWKRALLETGHYGEDKIDYLIEGDAVSSFAAEIQGMTSCRARVELRVIPVPGRKVLVVQKGVGAHADLSEALAAKSALEKACANALDPLVEDWAKEASR